MNTFDTKIGGKLKAADLGILQVNVGLKCNQSCVHCHLECSPFREEIMSAETMDRIVALADSINPQMVDITGGAPELNPNLKDFIFKLKQSGQMVQVRTNLSAMEEPGLTDFPQFFADNAIGLVASMPCYLEENVTKMRGDGCFSSSIKMLKKLNELGYGTRDGLTLDLVFNPGGPSLPPGQECLEQAYKKEMLERYSIVFNRLLTITNLPIGRYMEELQELGQADEYMDLLVQSFNPATVEGLMCRHQVNIGWDGQLYDCDFNQALRLPTEQAAPGKLDEFDMEKMVHRYVVTGPHCFGCTAGAGSSCGGAIES
ncbi:arsenosugar biosynthesis radical SAM (seleno)protein ArsS [Pseudodesulfovibrio sediminis]|uniref:Radical SAM/Cys-rich domain protein n=1 Tax=Pseudodesulfovibrio sediminis TaxID=2810563 RepID=A0ABM7P4A5_9BACT|nr:arsenosugar biosynthesis radical SAM (seleno)protein ArsS [Pseudodesulfovibrio sediminis]BCS87723.1 radical SAM/Cys-rich domain protein [Pseudodesulfovibrio sediminis]